MPPPKAVIIAKRKKVIESATRMFIERGYDEMTMDALTAEVGGSKTYVYRTFGDKSKLFEVVVVEACEDILQPLKDIDTDVDIEYLDLEKGLTRIAEGFLKVSLSLKSIALHRLIVGERLRFPHLGDVFLNSGPEQSYKRVAAYMKTQQLRGTIRLGDPYELAVQFLGMVNAGFLLKMLVAGHPLPSKAVLQNRIESSVALFTQGARSK